MVFPMERVGNIISVPRAYLRFCLAINKSNKKRGLLNGTCISMLWVNPAYLMHTMLNRTNCRTEGGELFALRASYATWALVFGPKSNFLYPVPFLVDFSTVFGFVFFSIFLIYFHPDVRCSDFEIVILILYHR